jgi:hypothetical protein
VVKIVVCFIISAIVLNCSLYIFAQTLEREEAIRARRQQAAREKEIEELQKPIQSKAASGNQTNIVVRERKALPFKQKLTGEQKGVFRLTMQTSPDTPRFSGNRKPAW